MFRTTITAAAVAAALTCSASLAQQTNTVITPEGPVGNFDIAGKGGIATPLPPEGTAFLYGMVIGERRDRPCYIKTLHWAERVDQSGSDPELIHELLSWQAHMCAGGGGVAEGVFRVNKVNLESAAVPGNGRLERSGHRRVAVGARICLNGKGDRVKGLKLKGAEILPNGTIRRDSALDDEFELPNCNTWQDWLECGSRRAITGVDLQMAWHSPSKKNAMQGLRIKCEQVRSQAFKPASAVVRPGSLTPATQIQQTN